MFLVAVYHTGEKMKYCSFHRSRQMLAIWAFRVRLGGIYFLFILRLVLARMIMAHCSFHVLPLFCSSLKSFAADFLALCFPGNNLMLTAILPMNLQERNEKVPLRKKKAFLLARSFDSIFHGNLKKPEVFKTKKY